MPFTRTTQNYGLPQWDSGDKPLREDFNIAMTAIDTQLSGTNTALGNKVNLSQLSNPNILHNWDFRNPVNQRAQLEYAVTANMYTIDRWYKFSGVQVYLTSDGLRLTTTSPSHALVQHIEFPTTLAGKTLTFSAIAKGKYLINVVASSGQLGVRSGNSENFITDALTFTVPQDVTSLYVAMRCDVLGSEAIYKSVKLELGTVSTIANDPPMDFGKELALCQRYYEIGTLDFATLAGPEIATAMYLSIPYKITKRIPPPTSTISYVPTNSLNLSSLVVHGSTNDRLRVQFFPTQANAIIRVINAAWISDAEL